MDNNPNRPTTSDDQGRATNPYAINLLPSDSIDYEKLSRFNAHGIPATAPPIYKPPRIFRPAELHHSSKHEDVFTAFYKTKAAIDVRVSNDNEDSEMETEEQCAEVEQRDLRTSLFEDRQREMRELAQEASSQRPPNDGMARTLFDMLNLQLDADDSALGSKENTEARPQEVSASFTTSQHPYPPIHRTGPVADHDRPFATYGQLDRDTISQQCDFNLTSVANQSQSRFRAKAYAITAHTNVSKVDVKNYILDQFGENKVQYICVGQEQSQSSGVPCLLIQIIFKDRIDRRKPFLQDLVGDHCNYQATADDLAWNEYIKKSGPVEEYNEFKSVQQLSSLEWVPASTMSSAMAVQPRRPSSKRPGEVHSDSDKRRKIDDDIIRTAMSLAEDSVDAAMDYIQEKVPSEFVIHLNWYLKAFQYVRLRAEEKADREGTIDKEYVWPDSFPECTPALRLVIEQWIEHHFFRAKRAKCLVLIGPSGAGKTSFALSLPGRVNYFQGHWNLDKWTNYARYSVYDDVPWDRFEKHGYPPMKALLTQNGELGANGKYRKITTINVRQPAIVLMNPENAGSLLAQPTTQAAREQADYWKKRATVYVMGPDEYFYKKHHHHTPLSATSATSSIGSNELRIGGTEEFDQMRQKFHQKRRD